VDAEEVIRVWVGVYAGLPHGGRYVGVSEEAITWRCGGLVGANWVEMWYAERGCTKEDVGGCSDGAEPGLSHPEFPGSVVSTALVVTESDVELNGGAGVYKELGVGKDCSVTREKLEVTTDESNGKSR
jgi:hypothetical protein